MPASTPREPGPTSFVRRAAVGSGGFGSDLLGLWLLEQRLIVQLAAAGLRDETQHDVKRDERRQKPERADGQGETHEAAERAVCHRFRPP